MILALAIAGAALALQGWRERIPTIDLVPHYLDAVALVRDGVIPTRGTISSYLAYNPPGPTWLMVPGVLATDDPRRIGFFVSIPLYAATLLGIYCLARLAFGRSTAVLAASLYAFSEIGLFVASSLWPRAPQPFFVWMVFWLQRWAINREPRALATALAVWAAGMYVFMEIAPAILLVPFFWYRYRAPIRFVPLAVAAAATVALWWPYLAYQVEHEFQDIRSNVLRSEVRTRPTAASGSQWCDPSITIVNENGEIVWSPEQRRQEDLGSTAGNAADAGYNAIRRIRGAMDNAVEGIAGTTSSGVTARNVVLFVAAALSVIAVALGSTAFRMWVVSRRIPAWPVRVALGLALLGSALAAPAVLVQLFSPDGSLEQGTRDALRWLQGLLVASAAILMLAGPLSVALRRLAVAVGANSSDSPARGFLVFALLIPWAALLGLVEPGRSDRLWWLWPLIAIFLAALVFHVVGTSGSGRRIVAVGLSGLLLCLSCVTPKQIARVQSSLATGWAGTDADEIRAVEYIASRVASSGVARVGYDLHFFRGIPRLSAVDPRFKVGAELDFVLSYRHGIINMSRCPEGLEADDEYRIADEAIPPWRLGTYRVVASPDAAFRIVRRFGRIRVLERLDPTAR